jgi:hypothetical protein
MRQNLLRDELRFEMGGGVLHSSSALRMGSCVSGKEIDRTPKGYDMSICDVIRSTTISGKGTIVLVCA